MNDKKRIVKISLMIALVCLSALFALLGIMTSEHPSANPPPPTPADLVASAKLLCGDTYCSNPMDAIALLSKVPASAPEYSEATVFLQRLQQMKRRADDNFAGVAHDKVTCGLDHRQDMSFDNGVSWWADDGRCREAQRASDAQWGKVEAQQARDADAELHSYWSTTVRVDTDMNSSWLADEERTCQTYPDEHGSVATVRCDADAKSLHNIPVTFWGGLDRNTISDWKCRRDKSLLDDRFVCRAID